MIHQIRLISPTLLDTPSHKSCATLPREKAMSQGTRRQSISPTHTTVAFHQCHPLATTSVQPHSPRPPRLAHLRGMASRPAALTDARLRPPHGRTTKAAWRFSHAALLRPHTAPRPPLFTTSSPDIKRRWRRIIARSRRMRRFERKGLAKVLECPLIHPRDTLLQKELDECTANEEKDT